MSAPKILIQEIKDQYLRANFQALQDYFKAQGQLEDFAFFDLNLTAAETGKKVAHGLSVAPLDILVTHLSGAGAVTFQYASFDTTYVILDVTAACRIRFFAGTCSKASASVQQAAGAAQKFTSGV